MIKTNNILSVNKIIILVAFICTALITSLFLFHLKSKTFKTTLTNDAGTIFPIAREIKPFELVRTNETIFTQKDFLNHWTLLFFGFSHCSSICPTTLDLIKHAYKTLHPVHPDLQVVFISLDPKRDDPKTLAIYIKSFHADFIGASGKIQELHKLQSQLGIFAINDEKQEMEHASSILLINPNGKWAGIFKNGLNPQALVSAIEESINMLTLTSV